MSRPSAPRGAAHSRFLNEPKGNLIPVIVTGYGVQPEGAGNGEPRCLIM